jgi:hypothetical protein
MLYQKIELPNIENIETKIHLGFVYFNRDEVKISFTREDLPEDTFYKLGCWS